MDSKFQKQIEEAKSHFYAWRMVEAYNILRRFFDRLPFRLEKEHAESIGMFVRVLGELGKTNELKFYVNELERHYDRQRDPAVAYTLAVVYMNLSEVRPESARKILEELLRDPQGTEYHVKGKIVLANYFDRFKKDRAACQAIIDSIGEVPDPMLGRLVDIWRGKLLRDAKQFEAAEEVLRRVSADALGVDDWYAYFSAQVMLAIQFLRQKRLEEASAVIQEVRAKFVGRHFKTVLLQLDALEEQIEQESRLGTLRVITNDESSTFIYSDKPLTLKRRSTAEKLLLVLMRRRFVDKSAIVKILYGREYDSVRDDKLVYYHIHSLRKRLQAIGLPPEAITSEKDGYRWVPEVENVGEQSCA